MTHGPRIPGKRLLHSPGPTRLPDEVLQAMSRQPVGASRGRALLDAGAKTAQGAVAALGADSTATALISMTRPETPPREAAPMAVQAGKLRVR